MKKNTFFFYLVCTLCACTATTPKKTSDVCAIFEEKNNWYAEAKESYEKWGLPIHVNMAIMYQESRFVANAQPPRTKLLGIIPWSRPSSAFGYAQVLDGTWDQYLKNKAMSPLSVEF